MNEATAFHALLDLLAGNGDGASWSCPEFPAIDRLRRALVAPAEQVSATDLAVLLRQVLIFESTRRNWMPAVECEVRGTKWQTFNDWAVHGLKAYAVLGGWRVSPEAWRPDWLDMEGTSSVDAWAASEDICRHFKTSAVPGDPFLVRLNRKDYRSVVQRDAVRASLRAPSGSTLVVTLATGEGKSLIPQAVAAIGYGSSTGHAATPGVTLVVVPTVALGLDQEAGAIAAGFSKPLTYRGGNQATNRQLVEGILAGTQSLCYASPEAVCGALREPLKAAARAGYLRAIIIDEAHLVDAWGTGFRTEFQLLGGVRRELISLSPNDQLPRTILLSATLTRAALATLRTLFGSPGAFSEFAAVSLRSEPEYWRAAPTTESERTKWVIEALHRAPRPAILYVTRVSDAEKWAAHACNLGFRRIRLVTSKTGLDERDAILAEWRDGVVDLVVATSAFGLGIDYPHVRSVIHACIPESLDRFYQEVGRGGRDGRACLSLLLPASDDWSVARRVSEVTVIGIDRGLQRWRAMFQDAEHIPNTHLFHVRLNTSPGISEDDIDMVGERSADWNARTLTLMERAGLIRQCGMHRRNDDYEPWQTVEILDHDHLHADAWQRRIGPERRAIAEANDTNFGLMRRYIEDQACVTRLLVQLYGDDRVAATCTSCAQCRTTPTSRIDPVVLARIFPWHQPQAPLSPLLQMLDNSNRLLVHFDPTIARDARWFRRLGEILEALAGSGMLNLTLLGNTPAFDDRVTKNLSERPWFIAQVNRLTPGRLPPGPEVILASEQPTLTRTNLGPREAGKARVFILPVGTESPDRPGIRLTQCFAGRVFHFDEFHQRLTR